MGPETVVAVATGVASALLVLWLSRHRRRAQIPPALPTTATGARPVHRFAVVPPARLAKFADVGGMEPLKAEMRDTVGLVLRHPEEAERYRITWNGLLLHGPPGVGKSFFVRALAGELGLNLIQVSTADLITDVVGRGPGLVEEAFATAHRHLPCLLLFDELDTLAGERDEQDTSTSQEVLSQLLQSLEEHRDEHRLVVAAATNDLESLDPAVVRAGRFDRHVRVDLPDADARRAVFAAKLAGRPLERRLDLDELARRTEGRTPAAIASACELAALAAFRQAIGTGKVVRIGTGHLRDALSHGGGEDRPLVEDWSWGKLVLPRRTLAELKQLQALLEDPEQSRALGVEMPSGVLLTGAPGTGKTTVAKVLAAEAACSFYPVSGADVTSQWVGESERRIARLFRRARANVPSIVFIDELDAIGARRGQHGAYDRQLDQLLQEMDGMTEQERVLVVGATNRPAVLDPALLRGGRLSRIIEIPLPDNDARLGILRLLTARMPITGVNLETLALETEGFSGADLKGLCEQAAMEALLRRQSARGQRTLSVTEADFGRALATGAHTVAARERATRRPSRGPRRT